MDVQISLDGATAAVNDAVRGAGSFDTAVAAMDRLAGAGFVGFKLSVVATRQNVDQLDAFKALADRYRAQLRLTRLRPSGRGADVWDELHPTAAQQRQLYEWLLAHGEDVLTGDSFFHLAGYGESLPGLNLCGAGRVVCLVDPVGDVYACPFAIHEQFLAGNVRSAGRFRPGLAPLRPVHRTPPAAERRGVWLLWPLRRLPRWVHGGQVLHRSPARRAGPRVRARPRGARPGRAGRGATTQAIARPLQEGRPGAGGDAAGPPESRGHDTVRPDHPRDTAPSARPPVRREPPGPSRPERLIRRSAAPVRQPVTVPVGRLATSTWPDLEDAARTGCTVVIPVGSTEQHGPHLPVTTDTDIAVAIVEAAASRDGSLLVAPPVAYGASGEHQDFPGTLSIGQDAT